ncbi:MAG: zinc-binding dehydrogenase [Alphaproteobacteria bacterium]|nr:zinc-binding dehydrogenase [Alphaproteobacteria bacterium]
MISRQWCIARRPVGNVKDGDCVIAEEPVPDLEDGQILLKVLYLGLVPVMRMYMLGIKPTDDPAQDIGDVVHGRAVAQVLQSRHPNYEPGDFVQGQTGWQTYKVTSVTPQERFLKLRHMDLPLSYGISVLSMIGYTAYFGFMECASAKLGDTMVISGAGGGVGSLVIQMARMRGCRIIGITGGSAKAKFVQDLGCDETIDHRADDIDRKLTELCPNGIDVYFDNVGGDILNTCLNHLALGARIVQCGSISEYMLDEPYGLTNYTNLRHANASMTGYFVYNYLDRFVEAEDQLADWIRSGDLKPVEDIAESFEQMPAALSRLYDGTNHGIQICHVADPDVI